METGFSGSNWAMDNAGIYAYAWDDLSNYRVFAGTKVDDDTFSFTILASKTKVLFVRMPNGTAFNGSNWDDKWNQSEDLLIDHSKTTAQITGWGPEGGKSPVSWVA